MARSDFEGCLRKSAPENYRGTCVAQKLISDLAPTSCAMALVAIVCRPQFTYSLFRPGSEPLDIGVHRPTVDRRTASLADGWLPLTFHSIDPRGVQCRVWNHNWGMLTCSTDQAVFQVSGGLGGQSRCAKLQVIPRRCCVGADAEDTPSLFISSRGMLDRTKSSQCRQRRARARWRPSTIDSSQAALSLLGVGGTSWSRLRDELNAGLSCPLCLSNNVLSALRFVNNALCGLRFKLRGEWNASLSIPQLQHT